MHWLTRMIPPVFVACSLRWCLLLVLGHLQIRAAMTCCTSVQLSPPTLLSQASVSRSVSEIKAATSTLPGRCLQRTKTLEHSCGACLVMVLCGRQLTCFQCSLQSFIASRCFHSIIAHSTEAFSHGPFVFQDQQFVILLLQALGSGMWLQQPRSPRKFHFPQLATSSLVSVPPEGAGGPLTMHEAGLMPSSPMSEDNVMGCKPDTPGITLLSSVPPESPCTLGWGSSAVSTSAGPLQIVQNLVMANIYLTQVNLQTEAIPCRSGQGHALEPAFLQSCCLQLEQAWHSLVFV